MGFGDFCNTGLSLGLGCELKNENRVKYDHLHHHHNNQQDKPCFKFDQLFHPSILTIRTASSIEPSLTLGLPDETYEPARKIDVKKAYEESVEVLGQGSSPHNTTTVSSFSNTSVKREKNLGSEEVGTEKVSSRVSDEDEEGSARKKLRLTKEQSAQLEDSFKEHSTLNPKQKQALAKKLNLRPRQVEVWFQNRRARTKLKQTEVDCEFLKKCCEKLTEENGRLQKELQELKVLKLGPAAAQFYMQLPSAAAALTICPSCERINGGGVGEQSSSSKSPFTIMTAKPNFLNSMTHHPSAAC